MGWGLRFKIGFYYCFKQAVVMLTQVLLLSTSAIAFDSLAVPRQGRLILRRPASAPTPAQTTTDHVSQASENAVHGESSQLRIGFHFIENPQATPETVLEDTRTELHILENFFLNSRIEERLGLRVSIERYYPDLHEGLLKIEGNQASKPQLIDALRRLDALKFVGDAKLMRVN